jgi:hypothetical protein
MMQGLHAGCHDQVRPAIPIAAKLGRFDSDARFSRSRAGLPDMLSLFGFDRA